MGLDTALEGGLIQQAGQRIPLCQSAQVLVHLMDLLLLGEDGGVVVAVGQRNRQCHDGRAGEVDLIAIGNDPAGQKHEYEIGAPVHEACQLCRHEDEYRYAQHCRQIEADLCIWISNQVVGIDADVPQQEKQHGSILNELIDSPALAAKGISKQQAGRSSKE